MKPAPVCSIARTLEVVGERWSLLILREATYGNTRFDQFAEHLGCARNLLTQRLATLVEHGVLARESYQEPGRRARPEYVLTDKGRDLYPALVALMQWGDEYLCGTDGPSLELLHRGCGGHVHAELTCEHGHVLTSADIERRPGPGARLTA